jgi:TIR domain-containing protein
VPNRPFKWDVFVSHNRRQKPWVRQMVRQLRECGLQVFFDEDSDSIPPGSPVLETLEQGLQNSKHLIFVITPSSVASDWVSLELSITLHQDPAAKKGLLIPLLLEKTPDSDIRASVRRLQRIDLTNIETRTSQYHALLRHLGVTGPHPEPPAWQSAVAQLETALESPLVARKSLRVPLTDVACLYYRHRCRESNLLIRPNGMPVLSLDGFLPDTPTALADLDKTLQWERNESRSNWKFLHGEMVKIQRSQPHPPQIYDGILYRFLGADSDGRFRFCRGSYFDFLNTCEFLSFEIAKAVLDHAFAREILEQAETDRYEDVASFLAQRNSEIIPVRTDADPLDFASRCTAFGTCALVIIKRTNKPPQMVLNLRSEELSETPDLLHVIPAGTFQPNMNDDRFHETEFSLIENLVREFAEELLDAEDLRKPRVEALDPEDMYSRHGKTFRQHVVRKGNYSVFYLGTIIDPVNLKPEILTVFMVHDGFLFNVGKHELVKSWESGRLSVHEFSEHELDFLIGKSNFVPTGKAHLMLVKKHFAFLTNRLADI